MDLGNLSRRELQSLCKKNKIPANITNIAMARALQALHSVEGLEDVLITEKTSLDSPAKTDIKQSAPRTSCRTSTRRKPVREEPQTTQVSTRTRDGRRRTATTAGQETDNAAPVDVVHRKTESQLAEDEKKGAETPAAMAAVSRRRTGTTSVRKAYGTRRSTRLLGKKMMGLNLDDVDNDQVVEGDAHLVEEMKRNEESVMDKAMEFEGIGQQKKTSNLQEKTDVSDDKHDALFEDSLMGEDNEEHSMKVKLQQKSEVFHESVDDKDADAEAFDENKGISQQKQPSDLQEQTGISDEKHAAELEDSLVNDNEESNLKVELQQKYKVFDESVDDKDVDAGVFDVNKGVLSSELTKMEPNIDTDGLVLENEEESLRAVEELEVDSTDQLEIDQEAHKAKDIISTSMAEEKSEDGESFSPQQSENEESLGLVELATDTINKDESVAQISEKKSVGEMSSVNHEAHKGLSERPTGLNQLPSEENIAFETGCGEKSDQPVAVTEMHSEKCDQISLWPVISESKIVDNFEGKFGISIENSMVKEKSEDSGDFSPQQLENEESLGLNKFATDSINEDKLKPEKSLIMIVARINEAKSEGELSSVNHEVQSLSEENMAFETGCGEKSDQPVAVAELHTEKCDQISSRPVISESKIFYNFGNNSETITSKATENINILSATNKENSVKEKVTKVKTATTDMSIRQLKKMLKQLQITDKNTDIKEDKDIAKQMEKARPALQPLPDNRLVSSKDENGN